MALTLGLFVAGTAAPHRRLGGDGDHGVNIGGLQRTVAVRRCSSSSRLSRLRDVGRVTGLAAGVVTISGPDESVLGALQAAGFLFAFAGYARIATLGEGSRP